MIGSHRFKTNLRSYAVAAGPTLARGLCSLAMILFIFSESAPALDRLKVCNTNPRFFCDHSGKAVFLTGGHTWNALIDGTYRPRVDFKAYMQWMEGSGQNFLRLWRIEPFSDPDPSRNSPMPWKRTGPGNCPIDGKPKFDLTQFDEAYFNRLRERAQIAARHGVYVSIMLFEGWWKHAWKENAWKGHPLNPVNNINHMPVAMDDIHRMRNKELLALDEAYVKRVIDAVTEYDNIFYEIVNEDGSGDVEWQYHLIRVIKDYESREGRKTHPVGMTFRFPSGNDPELFGSPADWISPKEMLISDGTKVLIWDNDHFDPGGRNERWPWQCLMKGSSMILMLHFPGDERAEVNRAMGAARKAADLIDLARMTPQDNGRYLARPGYEYLLITDETFEFDLSGHRKRFAVQWIDARTGEVRPGEPVDGGGKVTLRPPFDWAAVHLKAA
jgi:hypothetical protein